jgi:hypothetical protein
VSKALKTHWSSQTSRFHRLIVKKEGGKPPPHPSYAFTSPEAFNHYSALQKLRS